MPLVSDIMPFKDQSGSPPRLLVWVRAVVPLGRIPVNSPCTARSKKVLAKQAEEESVERQNVANMAVVVAAEGAGAAGEHEKAGRGQKPGFAEAKAGKNEQTEKDWGKVIE